MKAEIEKYNETFDKEEIAICMLLFQTIENNLNATECKIWHGHPVWFIDENPIVGYSKQKKGIRLMFWSGADFDESLLAIRGQKFKDASIFYNQVSEINVYDIERWIQKAQNIQWDYNNLIKRKGQLIRLK